MTWQDALVLALAAGALAYVVWRLSHRKPPTKRGPDVPASRLVREERRPGSCGRCGE